jgi:Fur family ferric uptake transcriptional regulator
MSGLSTAQLLQSAGLRRTRARKLILEMLNQVDRPLSHQEITSNPETRRLDRVTLYRTLTTLQKVGLLHRVKGIDGVWRFRGHRAHSDKCGGNHIHFLCLECSQMSCLPGQPLPWIKEPAGAKVFGKQLVVYGRCAQCRLLRRELVSEASPTPSADACGHNLQSYSGQRSHVCHRDQQGRGE